MFVTSEQDYRIIALEGDIDYGNSREISKELLALITEEAEQYILDVSRLQSVDSTGLAVLFSFNKKCHLKDKKCKLVAGHTSWYKLLHFSKLDRVLSLYPDVPSALSDHEPELSTSLSILEY